MGNLGKVMALIGCGLALMAPAEKIDAQLVRAELGKGEIIRIWPEDPTNAAPYAVKNTDGGNVRLTDVTRPELAFFAPQTDRPAPAVVICPGGAYRHLAYKTEGSEIAEWLRGQGIAAFVLKYRCPDCPDKALADVQRAISLVRSRAAELKVDPQRIGVMGFSAGGNLAVRVSTNWRQRAYDAFDGVDAISCRPDFALIVYPAYLVLKAGERNVQALPVKLRGEYPVDAQTPPAFIMQAQDDPAHVENAIAYCIALKEAGVGVDLHVFATGGHGFGLRKMGTATDGWEALAEEWLRRTIGLQR